MSHCPARRVKAAAEIGGDRFGVLPVFDRPIASLAALLLPSYFAQPSGGSSFG
jgi:hypothetical protein